MIPMFLFYSGYSIKPREGVDIDLLLEELNSKKMDRYIKLVSSPFQHGWFFLCEKIYSNLSCIA